MDLCILSGPDNSLHCYYSQLVRLHFKPFFSSLRHLVADLGVGGLSQAASHSALLFLILIDLDLFLCLAAMKKREVPRDWKKNPVSFALQQFPHPKTGSPLQDLLFEAEQK